jgi:hypothetical protein
MGLSKAERDRYADIVLGYLDGDYTLDPDDAGDVAADVAADVIAAYQEDQAAAGMVNVRQDEYEALKINLYRCQDALDSARTTVMRRYAFPMALGLKQDQAARQAMERVVQAAREIRRLERAMNDRPQHGIGLAMSMMTQQAELVDAVGALTATDQEERDANE